MMSYGMTGYDDADADDDNDDDGGDFGSAHRAPVQGHQERSNKPVKFWKKNLVKF